MARARNIKPALFKNELLGEADPLLTILFQGLWCLADREGRLEDRPKRIKAEIFPYRELPDFNGYLTELERLGFIERYEVGGVAVISVLNFAKHQSPHKTEKPSELPERPENTGVSEITEKAPLNNESLTVKESLIPDSLIPDSLCMADGAADPPSKGKSQRAKPKKTIPDNFTVTPEMADWARTNAPDVELSLATQEFINYWEGEGGVKADWVATWRNSMLKQQGFKNAKAQPGKNQPADSARLTPAQRVEAKREAIRRSQGEPKSPDVGSVVSIQ